MSREGRVSRRVLMLLSNAFRPDPRVHKEAKALVGGGYGITILAWDRERRYPSAESVDGIDVRRIKAGRRPGQIGTVIGLPLFWAKSFMAARNMPIDGVHVHDFDTLPVGYCLSRLRGVPLIYDAHEHYSRMVAIDVPMIVTRLIDRLELMLVAKSDLVITVCPDLASRYEGLKGPDVVIVTNCVDLPPLEMVKAPVPHQEVILFYGGTLEPMRYIEETIEAVRNAENVKLILAGNGRLSQMISREAASSPNLEYLGYLEWNALMRVMATADAVLCLLDPRNENYRIAIANRLCEGMAYGVPVIASRGTLSGEIVQAEGAGIVIEWSPENLLAAIDELRDSQKCMAFGRNGRAAAQREYNWDIMKARLLDAYQKILGSH